MRTPSERPPEKAAAEGHRAAAPEDRPALSRHPEILQGQVCLTGTRVPVDILLGCVREGLTLQEFLEQYPTVPKTQVEAALDQIQVLREVYSPLPED